MTAFLLYIAYIARAGLYLSLFYAFYLLVMRRTTFFRLNRVLLLAGSYLCLLLPLIRLRTINVSVFAEPLTMVAAGEEAGAVQAAFPWQTVLMIIYLAGMLATLILYSVSTWKMKRVITKGAATEMDGCRLVLTEDEISSFSWGRNVVMSRKDYEDNPAIFTHEKMHVKCRHSLDLILFLPVQLLFWWNPLVWITREELRLLHEYEADEGVIQKGIDATQYQLLLVRKAVGENRFTLASGFQHAQLKKRIAMMLKSSSSRWMRWSYLALIPVLTVFMFACNPSKSQNAQESEPVPAADKLKVETKVSSDVADQDAVSFSDVERKPTFNGGDANEFARWVNSQLKYPEQAKTDGAEGRVMLQFTIGTDGAIRDVKVLRSAREDLDAEAVRVVSSSPKWEPGANADGKLVPVTFNFPIVYQLR